MLEVVLMPREELDGIVENSDVERIDVDDIDNVN